MKHAVANVFREFGSYKYKYVSCSYNRKCDVINKVSDKKKRIFFLFFANSDLKRQFWSSLIVNASCVLYNDGHLRFIENRLGNHSQDSIWAHESQFKFSISSLWRQKQQQTQYENYELTK